METCIGKSPPEFRCTFAGVGLPFLCYPLRAHGSKYFGADMRSAFAVHKYSCGAGCSALWRRFVALARCGGGSHLGGCNAPTAAQQGAAPDRLQLRSFLTSLPAAGELGRSVAARGLAGYNTL
jgi:hypothetical protein